MIKPWVLSLAAEFPSLTPERLASFQNAFLHIDDRIMAEVCRRWSFSSHWPPTTAYDLNVIAVQVQEAVDRRIPSLCVRCGESKLLLEPCLFCADMRVPKGTCAACGGNLFADEAEECLVCKGNSMKANYYVYAR